MTAELDPWGTPPEPVYLTRSDRIRAAADVIASADVTAPTAAATAALQAAYPELHTAAELDALPYGTLIISGATDEAWPRRM